MIKATATKHKRKAKPKTKTFRVRKRLVRVGAGKHGSSTFKLTISNLRARRRR